MFQGGVPLIDYENLINIDDDQVGSYRTGPTTEMESRFWGRQRVTLRRIQREELASDHLLKEEQRKLRQLRLCHPGKLIYKNSNSNIFFKNSIHFTGLLQLMGVTQFVNRMQLVYEPVQLGSLYHQLHVARSHIPDKMGVLIQVAEALNFLHSRNLLHCSVSSNSVHLISPHVAKLGCYETLTDINSNHSDL